MAKQFDLDVASCKLLNFDPEKTAHIVQKPCCTYNKIYCKNTVIKNIPKYIVRKCINK